MTRPLEKGDLCEVVAGLGRSKSPNIGLRVTVRHRLYGNNGADHAILGAIYRCDGPGVQQMTDAGAYVATGWADFSGTWLRRIEPDVPAKAVSIDQGVAA